MNDESANSGLPSRGELRRHAPAPRPATGIARHGRLRKASPVGTISKIVAASLAVVLVSGVSVAAIAVTGLTSKATVVDIPEAPGSAGALPQPGAIEGGFNILIAGSDTREDQGGIGGTVEDDAGNLNDVNMLLHVSEDQTNAVAISFPRDLIVDIPDCTDEDGNTKVYSTEPLNTALSYGGLGCVAQTITELTGLPVQYAGLIKFYGVINMADAIGGVDVCVDGPMVDPKSGIDLETAGTYNLKGEQALAFLRSRAAVGDGSDLTRISSQQVYLSSLVRQLKSSDTLGDLTKVYGLADAALSNMTVSSSLNSPTTMVSIAQALRTIPIENVTFVQYPGTTGEDGIYSGKVRPDTYTADKMMEFIKNDQSFALDAAGDGRGSTLDPNAPTPDGAAPPPADTVDPPSETVDPPAEPADPSADPSAEPGADTGDGSGPDVLNNVRGQTAAQYTCTITNSY